MENVIRYFNIVRIAFDLGQKTAEYFQKKARSNQIEETKKTISAVSSILVGAGVFMYSANQLCFNPDDDFILKSLGLILSGGAGLTALLISSFATYIVLHCPCCPK